MKLVEILARELNEWPVYKTFPLRQADDDSLYVSAEHTNGRGTNYLDVFVSKSENPFDDVTRAQWEAERARIAAEEAPTWHIGTETEDWRNNCQKQYEQELWDRVAVMILEKVTDLADTIYGAATCAADQADAFMAERAKRMKK